MAYAVFPYGYKYAKHIISKKFDLIDFTGK